MISSKLLANAESAATFLTLMGNDEISAAGLNYIHEDRQEREMDYEPDYGND